MTLDEWLAETGTSARALAKAAGMSSGHVTDIRTGRRRVSIDAAQRIAEATGGAVPVTSWPHFRVLLGDGQDGRAA